MKEVLGVNPLRRSLFKKTGRGREGGAGEERQPEPRVQPEVEAAAPDEQLKPAPLKMPDRADIEALPSELRIVSFKLDRMELGVDIRQVQRIVRMVEITPVPKSPDFLEGVVDVMGRVVPVLSLRKLFRLKGKDPSLRTHILIGNLGEKSVGTIVDAVSDVLNVSRTQIEVPSLTTPLREFLLGVAKLGERIMLILDLKKVLSFQEQTLLEQEMRFDFETVDFRSLQVRLQDEADEEESAEQQRIRTELHRRAVDLSRTERETESEFRKVVIFALGPEWYAFHAAEVRWIVRPLKIVPVPCTPRHVAGIMNLRGDILPVVDLRRFFRLEETAGRAVRIIVVEEAGVRVGFVVDAVQDVVDLPASLIEPPLLTIDKIEAEYIEGEARWNDHLVGILDVAKTVSPEEAA